MPTRRCCCGGVTPGCDVAEDDFNRADSASLGSLWNEDNGDGEIASNRLKMNSGVVMTTARQIPPIAPGTNYAHSVVVTLIGTGASEWNIVVNLQDEDNYSFVRFTKSGTEWLPEFYDHSGGSDTLVMDITTHPESPSFSSDVNGNLRVQVCYAEAEWSVSDVNSQASWTNCDATPVTTLPTDATQGLVGFKDAGIYDDWDYNVHWESRRDCLPCTCFCERSDTDFSCIPEVLTLTLVPVGGAYTGGIAPCPDPFNLTFTLVQVAAIMGATEPDAPTLGPNLETASKTVWHSGLISGEPGDPNIYGRYHRIMMVCDGNEIYLTVQQNPKNDAFFVGAALDATTVGFDPPDLGAVGNRTAKYYNPARSSCDPLSLVFEDFRVTAGVGCPFYSLEYEAVVTA